MTIFPYNCFQETHFAFFIIQSYTLLIIVQKEYLNCVTACGTNTWRVFYYGHSTD